MFTVGLDVVARCFMLVSFTMSQHEPRYTAPQHQECPQCPKQHWPSAAGKRRKQLSRGRAQREGGMRERRATKRTSARTAGTEAKRPRATTLAERGHDPTLRCATVTVPKRAQAWHLHCEARECAGPRCRCIEWTKRSVGAQSSILGAKRGMSLRSGAMHSEAGSGTKRSEGKVRPAVRAGRFAVGSVEPLC